MAGKPDDFVTHLPGRPTVSGGLVAALPPNQVELLTEDFELSVRARLLAPPQPLGGGGVEAVPRPQRRPLTVYRSPEAPGLTLELLLDGWREQRSVEPECRALEKLAGAFLPSDPGPEKLIVVGDAVPHCSGAEALRHRWVISEQPDWNDDPAVIRDVAGNRVRQAVALTLLLFTEATELQRVKPRQPKPKYKVAIAQKGDTYEKVAARRLGSKRLGRKLAQLNGDRDPTKKLREGHKVRLPSASLLAGWRKDLKIGG